MNLRSTLLVLFMVLLSTTVLAEPLVIYLRGPSDGVTVTDFKISFIYGFSLPPDMKNCTLVINGAEKETRGDLIDFDNNKITSTLEQGEHTWQIRCLDSSNAMIESEIRDIIVDAEVNLTDGYEVVYNKNRFRSYVVPVREGKEPVTLPAVIANEEIVIKTSKASHHLDVLKMGSQNGVPFVELRDRTNSKILKILEKGSVDLEFEKDEIVDARLTLETVERNIKSYFVVYSFPGVVPPVEEEEPVQETPVETTEEESTPVELPAEEETPVEEEASEPAPEQNTITEPKQSSGSAAWLVWVIVLVVLGGAAAFFFMQKKGARPEFKHTEPVRIVKEKKEERQSDDSSFDVIKSTASKKRK